MGKMNEIFVAIKETDYIEAQIGGLCEMHNPPHTRSVSGGALRHQ